MKIASVADVKSHFSAYLKESEESPVVVTRHGKPVAILLGVEDDEDLDRLMIARSPRIRAILADARNRMEAGLGVPHEQFWEGLEG